MDDRKKVENGPVELGTWTCPKCESKNLEAEDVCQTCGEAVDQDEPEVDEAGLEKLLSELFIEATSHEEGLERARVSTFEEEGVLTRDRGIVLRLRDGAEFQISIVRSR